MQCHLSLAGETLSFDVNFLVKEADLGDDLNDLWTGGGGMGGGQGSLGMLQEDGIQLSQTDCC